MRESFTSYHCDGPDCDTTTVAPGTFDMMGPTGWYQLRPPDTDAADLDETLHFDRIECLTQWAADQIALRLGLGQ